MLNPSASRPRVSARVLRTALDQAVDAVVLADATGRIVYANAAVEQLVGLPATHLVGRHFIVALAEGDSAGAYDAVSAALSEGRSWSGSRAIRTAEGLHVKVEIVTSPVRDLTGAATHVLSIARSTGTPQDVPVDTHGEPLRASTELDSPAGTAAGSAPRSLTEPMWAPLEFGAETRAEVERIIGERAFRPIFQPIVHIADGSVIGYEGLTRFEDGCPPEKRFAHACACGLGIELEVVTLEAVIAAAREIPGEGFVSLNVSPALVLDVDRLRDSLAELPRPIVLEITERERVDDYAELRAAIARIGIPLRWAIDDAGAGFASLRHILELRPQFLKLDRALISGIALDPIRQALIAGLLHFSDALGTTLVAEGIESEAERLALHALGVTAGQGFLFGAPSPASGTGD